MSGIKISEIKQIPDSDVTNVDSFLVLDKETGKTKRLTVQQFTLFTLATLFSSQQGGAFSDKGVLYINETDFRTDPQQRFVWDYDTGRLGIGTATPEATLDVRGSILLNGYRFSESSTNPRALTIAANSVQNAGAGTIAIGDSIMIGADSNAVGNIGIGAYALQNNITGDYNIGIGYNAGKNITGTGNIIIGSYQGTAGDNNIVLSNGQDGVARLLIDSAGNVGIGTTSPRNLLELGGSANRQLRIGGIYSGPTSGFTANGQETTRHEILFSSWRDVVPDTVGAKITAINKTALGGSPWYLVQNTDLVFSTLEGYPSGADNTLERMRILSNGNVGVGTTEPASRLHISGSTGLTVNTVGNVWAVFGSDVVTSNYMAFRRPNSVASLGFLGSGGGGALTAGTASDLAIRSESSLYLATGGNNARMVIDSAGNVGIGITDPQAPLEVVGGSYNIRMGPKNWYGGTAYPTVYGSHPDGFVMLGVPHVAYLENGVNGYTGTTLGAFVRFAGNAAAGSYWDAGIASNIGTDKFVIRRNNSTTPFLAIDNTGNVGIGREPGSTTKLWVNGIIRFGDGVSADQYMRIANSTGYFYAGVREVSGLDQSGTTSQFYIKTDGVVNPPQIVINRASNGRIGINTDNPTKTLHVQGSAFVSSNLTLGGSIVFQNNGQGIDFGASAGGGSTSNLLDDYEEGTFTPTANFNGTAVSTYTIQYGRYIKIGKFVKVEFKVTGTTPINGTSYVVVGGIPYGYLNSIPSNGPDYTGHSRFSCNIPMRSGYVFTHCLHGINNVLFAMGAVNTGGTEVFNIFNVVSGNLFAIEGQFHFITFA